MAKPQVLKIYRHVEYRCIHCQKSFGDPDRQGKLMFIVWLRDVLAHVLLVHNELVAPEKLDLVNAYVVPMYF